MKSDQIDAYRYFFPAGWILGIWGVVLWILFPWNLVSYPGLHHPEIMMGGFFLCFVCGFLMTAAPRFTSSFGPTKADYVLSGILIASLFFSLGSSSKGYFYFVVISTFVFLMTYMARRFLARKSNPPDSFIFVGLGLALGFVGSLILGASELFEVPVKIYNLGRLFFMQAYILCLVLGVGSRLVPALFGAAPLPTEKTGTTQTQIRRFLIFAALFLLSYLVEGSGIAWTGNLLRALVMSFMLIMVWKIQKLPKRKGYQPLGLWASAWFILLGQWGIVFVPSLRIHFLHVIFISGLALMTLMIAVRVGLSHGNHDMNLERNSKSLLIGAALIAIAGLTRLSAGFAPHIYQSHLVYAAYTWILGLLVWGWLFLPKIVRVKGP